MEKTLALKRYPSLQVLVCALAQPSLSQSSATSGQKTCVRFTASAGPHCPCHRSYAAGDGVGLWTPPVSVTVFMESFSGLTPEIEDASR